MRTVTIQLTEAQAIEIRNGNPQAGTTDQRDPNHEQYEPGCKLRRDVPATPDECRQWVQMITGNAFAEDEMYAGYAAREERASKA